MNLRNEPGFIEAIDTKEGTITMGGFGAFGEREAERAKQLGMDPYQFIGYQAALREDYANMFPPTGKEPRTVLGMGLVPLLAYPEEIGWIGWTRVPVGTFAAQEAAST